MPLENAAAARMIRHEIARHSFDSSRLEVHVMHGVVYLQGMVSRLRSHPEIDLTHEMELLTHILRQKPGVREVVCEVNIRK